MVEKINWATGCAILGVLAICMVIAAFAWVVAPPTSKPIPTAAQPTLTSAKQYQPEVIPASTDIPNSIRTATVTPTDRPAPAWTPTTTLLPLPIGKSLPDLTISRIGDAVCASSNINEVPTSYIKITVTVRNIGQASTHSFGSFNVGVYILLGESSYGLDEWADTYDGVVVYPNMTFLNLDPNWERTFTMALDMKGNVNFGIKAVANSGDNPIREIDMTNNTLIKSFSVYCY